MDKIIEAIEIGLSKFWLEFLGVIFLYFLWKFNFLIEILPLVGTIFLGWVAFRIWLHYIQQDFISGIDWVLLEIIPPRDVLRSPKSMELFLSNALYHFSYKGGVEEYWQGAVWFWFSLEVVSIEGQVHFYIRTPSRVKSLIETQMYAQYPQSQIKVVEDYTLAVDEISEKSAWNLWGCEFKLLKPDAYPIRTYVDFGLDKDPKEEYKVDPISSVVELFGSISKGEQMWCQIVVTPSKKKYYTNETLFGHHDWVDESKFTIEKLLRPYTRKHPGSRPDGGDAKEIRAPGFLDNIVKGISNKTTKIGFDCGIRACYVAKKESFNANNRRALRLIFRQYANPDANQFWRINSTQPDAFGLSSELFIRQSSLVRMYQRMLEEYRERSFFHPPLRHHIPFPWPISPFIFPAYFHHKIFVLNVEELATIFHFPGQILKVPTLTRIESKEASPPPNLPI